MTKINIYTINKISSSSPENKIILDYLKRLPWKIAFHELEIKGKFPPEKQKLLEGEMLLKSIPSNSFIIALDERGKSLNSAEFANIFEKVTQPIAFVIGGAYGLSDDIKSSAGLLLSLSDMTMPHMLARVMLVEQLYRAYTINIGHPYHK